MLVPRDDQEAAHCAHPGDAEHGRTTAIFALVLTLIACATYATSLSNGFALDDVHIIQQNRNVHALDPGRLWSSPYWPSATLGLYRPLTSTLFAVQWAAGGSEPLLFHVTNVALHATAVVLVFYLLLALPLQSSVRRIAAVLGAALFAVHPVHVEAVANVVGQGELTAAVAVLGACLIHATRAPGLGVPAGRLVLVGLLYAVGLAAKEHAIVLPALLVLIDAAQGRMPVRLQSIGNYGRAMIVPFGALLAIALVFLGARAAVLGSVVGSNPNPGLAYLQGDLRIWNALRAWPEYYRLLLFPIDLSVDYSPGVIPVARGLEPMTILGALLLLLAALYATRVGQSLFGLAAAWLLVCILPVSNLLFPVGVLVAERTLYLPSVAASVAVAAASARLLPSGMRGRLALAAAGVVLLTLGIRSLVRARIWESTATVQQSLVRDHPESFRAQWILAAAAANAGDRRRAALHYDLADRIYGDDPLFLLEYANFHMKAGNTATGLVFLQRVRQLDPSQVPARLMSAYVFNRIGEPDSALALLQGLRREGRVTGDVELEIARALDGVGEYARAADAWRAGARTEGTRAWVYYAFAARSAARAGDGALARDALSDAARSAPADDRAAGTLAALERLIESGCYQAGTCEGDPLSRPTGNSAEGNP